MIHLERSVITSRRADEVFAYLADFTTTTEWDPGSIRTTRISGDGRLGTRYLNTSRFNGQETSLEYEVIEFEPGRRIRLRGANRTVTAIDTITVEPMDDVARVTYTAEFVFNGLTRLAEPFLRGAFERLADEAEEGLRTVLGGHSGAAATQGERTHDDAADDERPNGGQGAPGVD